MCSHLSPLFVVFAEVLPRFVLDSKQPGLLQDDVAALYLTCHTLYDAFRNLFKTRLCFQQHLEAGFGLNLDAIQWMRRRDFIHRKKVEELSPQVWHIIPDWLRHNAPHQFIRGTCSVLFLTCTRAYKMTPLFFKEEVDFKFHLSMELYTVNKKATKRNKIFVPFLNYMQINLPH